MKFNKYSNGVYNPQPNYKVGGPDLWEGGILSKDVHKRLWNKMNQIGKMSNPKQFNNPQVRYLNSLTTPPIKPLKRVRPRDSIFANFGMIGVQPQSNETQAMEQAKHKQEKTAGVVNGAGRKKKIKAKGATKKTTLGRGKVTRRK